MRGGGSTRARSGRAGLDVVLQEDLVELLKYLAGEVVIGELGMLLARLQSQCYSVFATISDYTLTSEPQHEIGYS